jgi:hypothetical protein
MQTLSRVIFFLSAGLMVLLAVANNGYATDDHFTVIEIIAQFKKQPVSTQCWQCYHPKLYHWIVAKIWNLFGLESHLWKQISAQFLNACFGVGTLVLVRKFIFGLNFSLNIKLIVFALIALNPSLISIFSFATNDAMVIFLGNLALYSTLKLYKEVSMKHAIILILSVVLGTMTKHNSIIFFLGSVISLVAFALTQKNYFLSLSKGYLGTALLIIIFSIVAVLTFNGYYKAIIEEEKPFTYNTPLHGLPPIYKTNGPYLPGINTIYSGYFKFYYFDLIRNPQLIVGPKEPNIKHLTSHFSQLYGRTHFLYFQHWPPQWQSFNPLMIRVGSITLALAILPTIILLFGVFFMLYSVIVSVLNRNLIFFRESDLWVTSIFFIGYLSFSIIFSLFGRIYVFMKDIYLFPGLLSVIIPFCIGHRYFFGILKSEMLKKVYYSFICVFALLYLLPVVDLIFRMFSEKFS